MGKAKPTAAAAAATKKKPGPSSSPVKKRPLKISASLFKRRLSKNSTGQLDRSSRDSDTTAKTPSKTSAAKTPSHNDKSTSSTNKRDESSSGARRSSPPSRRGSIPSPPPSPQPQKKSEKNSSSSAPVGGKKGKSPSVPSSKSKGQAVAVAQVKKEPAVKVKGKKSPAAVPKGKSKVTSSVPLRRGRQFSGGSMSSSSAGRNSSSSSVTSGRSSRIESSSSSSTASESGGKRRKKQPVISKKFKTTPPKTRNVRQTKTKTTSLPRKRTSKKSDEEEESASPPSSSAPEDESTEDDEEEENESSEDNRSSGDVDDDGPSSRSSRKATPSKVSKNKTPASTKTTTVKGKKAVKKVPVKKKVTGGNKASSAKKIVKRASVAVSKNNKKETPSSAKTKKASVGKKESEKGAKSKRSSEDKVKKGKVKHEGGSTASKMSKKDKEEKTSSSSSSGGKRSGKTRLTRPKVRRMASLNAKAILEASFSFENQEKRQRSPVPVGAAKVKEELTEDLPKTASSRRVSVSVSTSPIPPPLHNDEHYHHHRHSSSSSSIPVPSERVGDGERRRKSGGGERRESSTSNKSSMSTSTASINKNHDSRGSKPGSRRNSAAATTTSTGESGGIPASSFSHKKKTKTTSTSTSTSTSPPPPALFHPPAPPTSEDDRLGKQKAKMKKHSKGVGSQHNHHDHRQDSGVHHGHKGGGGKERKSSSSTSSDVSHFGTIYQPAGPLIEPHKTSTVPAGLLPETVKLPADLKVTYQSRPPSSGQVPTASSTTSSSNNGGSSGGITKTKKHGSTSSHHHHKDRDKILHQPYKSSSAQSSSSRQGSVNVGTSASATASPLLQSSSSITMAMHPQSSGGSHSSASSGPSAGGLFYSSPSSSTSSGGFVPHHHSPFAPNKYPMVPPESYRTHSPYQSSFLYPSTTPAAAAAVVAAQQAQQSQGYFMTPFYTPPLTPNSSSQTVLTAAGGLGGAMHAAGRPLSLQHPSIAATPFYAPSHSAPTTMVSPPGIPGLHPSNYLVAASPHHPALQPPTVSPGHAGLFPPNRSTQPACPYPPMDSSHPLLTPTTTSSSNNKQPRQQHLSHVFNGSLHPATTTTTHRLEQQPSSSVCTTTRALSKTSKHANKHPYLSSPPPMCTTDTPPITIQLLSRGSKEARGGRGAEALTTTAFSDQYSLPDDITITPIVVKSGNAPSRPLPPTCALLLKNTSISIVNDPTPPPSCVSPRSRVNTLAALRKKEKDIVHVIDPRSGLKTTIAKHISNRQALLSQVAVKATITNNRVASPPRQLQLQQQKAAAAAALFNAKQLVRAQLMGKKRAGATATTGGVGSMGKLNPDLDVIVINNNNMRGNNDYEGDIDDDYEDGIASENLAHHAQATSLLMKRDNGGGGNNNNNRQSDILMQQLLQGARSKKVVRNSSPAHNNNSLLRTNHQSNSLLLQAFASSTNGSVVKKTKKTLTNDSTSLCYALPPGISISSGVNQSVLRRPSHQTHGLNLSLHNRNSKVVQMRQVIQNDVGNGRKRVNLQKCIDGLLETKRIKLLEDGKSDRLPYFDSVNVIPVKGPLGGGKKNSAQTTVSLPRQSQFVFNRVGVSINGTENRKPRAVVDSSYSSARVRDPQLNRGGRVIKAGDAVVAASAVVVDAEAYRLKQARLTATANGNSRFLKNGFATPGAVRKGGKLVGGKSYLPPHHTIAVGMTKASKGSRSTCTTATKTTRTTFTTSKGRTVVTRVATKRDVDSAIGTTGGRNRARLLRRGGHFIRVCLPPVSTTSNPTRRSAESDSNSSSNTSRSGSAVRSLHYHGPSGLGKFHSVAASQAYLNTVNALADLYQYRRNVLLRVPRASVGVFPSASSIIGESDGGTSSGVVEEESVRVRSPSPTTRSGRSTSPTNSIVNVEPQQLSQLVVLPNQQSEVSSSTPSPRPGTPTVRTPPVTIGSMAASAAKKRAMVKPLSPAAVNGALLQFSHQIASKRTPKWSNGWRFEGDPYEAKVYLNNDDHSVLRRCYPAMRHESGDVIQTRDCVLLKSGSKKNDLPFIGKIVSLWENPIDGEMMFTLIWYYRPEHTEMGRAKEDMIDEVFASKHIDVNSVATIDDRCYVLTFSEYCRYRKRLKQLQEGLPDKPLLSLNGTSMINKNAAGKVADAVWSGRSTTNSLMTIEELKSGSLTITPSTSTMSSSSAMMLSTSSSVTTTTTALSSSMFGKISPEAVFFCRKVYDFRQKRIVRNPS